MAGDIFGGLGDLKGLVKGFAGLMPQDKPEAKMIKASSEIDDLNREANEIYAEIGKAAYERNPEEWPQGEKLKEIAAKVAECEARFKALEEERAAAERAKEESESARRCPACGHLNAEGMKFCQECGAKLGKTVCTACGAEIAPGARFCGACGARQE
jgi:outer membrane murein-binding lipoprotein Lpp